MAAESPTYVETKESQAIVTQEAPPSYSGPEGQPVPDEPPPSYDSLFGRVKAAKQEADTKPQFVKKILGIFLGTLGCTICLGVFLAIPISMIVIGALYVNDCPEERMIPIYLIVAGSVGLIKNCSSLGQKIKNDRENAAEEENVKTTKVDSFLNCFLFIWFIVGNVYVYRTYDNWNRDPTSSHYCHPTLYYFAFWIITSTYILLGATCFFICCAGCIAACLGGD